MAMWAEVPLLWAGCGGLVCRGHLALVTGGPSQGRASGACQVGALGWAELERVPRASPPGARGGQGSARASVWATQTRVALGASLAQSARSWGGRQAALGRDRPLWPAAGPLRVSPEKEGECAALESAALSVKFLEGSLALQVLGLSQVPSAPVGPQRPAAFIAGPGAGIHWELSPGLWRGLLGVDTTRQAWPPRGWQAVNIRVSCLSFPVSRHLSPAGGGPSRGWWLRPGLHGHEVLFRRLSGHLRARLFG